MSVVDFGELEKYIKEIEQIFKKNDLNIVEQNLILQQAHQRISRKMEQQKAQDMLENLPLPGMVKRLMGKGRDEE